MLCVCVMNDKMKIRNRHENRIWECFCVDGREIFGRRLDRMLMFAGVVLAQLFNSGVSSFSALLCGFLASFLMSACSQCVQSLHAPLSETLKAFLLIYYKLLHMYSSFHSEGTELAYRQTPAL